MITLMNKSGNMSLLLDKIYVMKQLKSLCLRIKKITRIFNLLSIILNTSVKNIQSIKESRNISNRGKSISQIEEIIPKNYDGKYSISKFIVSSMPGMKNSSS